jgi:metallo-beta-lactamase family protein
MKLTFYGGAGTVTGANYCLESSGSKILIDCGLMQGGHFAEKQNFKPFPYDPKDIKAVFITHAHIDHIGRLPKLYRDGFRGKIYSTEPTRDFAELMLLDSQQLLAKEAEREKEKPIYSLTDVREVMKIWEGKRYHESVEIDGCRVTFYDAGHILGSAIVQIECENKKILFSGDLGNYPAPIIKPTERLHSADYCLIESTYGSRIHEATNTREELLEDVIEEAVKDGGTLMIPAFAMERTQDLLFHINQLVEGGRIPKSPVYIDSPLAIHLTEIYKKYSDYFNSETQDLIRTGDDILNFPGLQLSLTTEQSKAINEVKPPKIIIAGSGMSQGGRILHHERRYLPDPKSTILFIGYQAVGSLGRKILEGAETVSIFGEDVQVKCRVRSIAGYSAHADQPRLIDWLRPMRQTLKQVFVVQGENDSSMVLASKIEDELAIKATVPNPGQEFVL